MMCLYRYAADNHPYSYAHTCRHHDAYEYTHTPADGYTIGSDLPLILKAHSGEER